MGIRASCDRSERFHKRQIDTCQKKTPQGLLTSQRVFGGITAETQGHGIVLSVRFVLVSHLEASIGRVAIYIDKVQTVVSSVGQEPDLSG